MTTRNLATCGTSAATGKLDSSVNPDGSSKYPTYAPIYKLNLSALNNGDASPIFSYNSPIVTTAIAGVNTSKCLRIKTAPSNPAVVCGSNYLAGE